LETIWKNKMSCANDDGDDDDGSNRNTDHDDNNDNDDNGNDGNDGNDDTDNDNDATAMIDHFNGRSILPACHGHVHDFLER